MLAYMTNPGVEASKKKETLATLAKEAGFNAYTLNFFNLLVDAGRIDAIEQICAAFEVQYCKLTDTQVRAVRRGWMGAAQGAARRARSSRPR